MSDIILALSGFGPMEILALILLWMVLPFAVFRVSPYTLFKLAAETHRLNKQESEMAMGQAGSTGASKI